MSPFRVTCVTCSARLAVRDERLVGQILACPKCGSMVHVVPPAAHADSSSPPTAAASAAPQPSVAPTPSAPKFDDLDAHLAEPTAPGSSSIILGAASLDAPPIAVSTQASQPAPASLSARTSWTSIAVIAGSAVLGAAVVAGAMRFLLTPAATTAVVEPQPAVEPASPAPHDEPRPKSLDPKPERAVAANPSAAASQPPSTEPAASPTRDAEELFAAARGDEASAAPIDSDGAQSAEPPDDAPRVAAAADDLPPETPATGDAPKLVIEPAEEAAAEFDPLELDPEGLNLTSLFAKPRRTTTSPDPSTTDPPPDQAPETDDAAAAGPQALAPVRRDPASTGLPAHPSAATALAQKFPAISVKGMPLCRFLDFATQAAGTPVSVAPQQLRLAGTSAAQTVSVEAADASLRELLERALKPIRLKPEVVDDQIVLVRMELPKQRTIAYDVADLVPAGQDEGAVAAWIRKLVEPEAWTAGTATIDAAPGKLAIDAPEAVQYDVLVLLESIRAARQLPPKMRYPVKLLLAESPYVEMSSRLNGPAVFTFVDYAPLREVFRYWQEEAGIAVLVDWQALAAAGLGPQSRIACSQRDVPWHAALDAVLEPLGLGWRAVGPRTIEITTRVRLQVARDTFLYAAKAAPSDDAVEVAPGLFAVRGLAAEHRRLSAVD